MEKEHHYEVLTTWHGNRGSGTSGVRDYDRSHTVTISNKPELHLTTDNPLVGDKKKLNPEDLLVSAISSCHMLSYLYVCALEGVVIIAYEDTATGIMIEQESGGGKFSEVTLNPGITVANETMVSRALELHHRAHEICYIAGSVNFPVNIRPVCSVAS